MILGLIMVMAGGILAYWVWKFGFISTPTTPGTAAPTSTPTDNPVLPA